MITSLTEKGICKPGAEMAGTSHLMSAQLGKCGVNTALRNSWENREIPEYRENGGTEERLREADFIMDHRVD